MKTRRAIAPLACLGCAIAGCATREPPRLSEAQRFDQYLREARLGTPITTVSEALGGFTPEAYEAGSGLYPFWTLRGRVGTIGVALGAVGPPEMKDASNSMEELQYIGHFIVQGDNWHSIRWVYTDGLVRDSRELIRTKERAPRFPLGSCPSRSSKERRP